MKKKHILIVSQHYFPEQFRVNDIAETLINRGHEVTILTGIPNFPEGKFYKGYGWFSKRKENVHGVNIIRLPIVARGNNFVTLGLNYASYVACGFFWNLFTKIKADIVITYAQTPITQAIPAIQYARKRKISHILYVLDLWPESVEVVTGVKNQFILGQIGKLVDYIYKRSDKILASSESNVEEILKRNVSKEKVAFWPQYAEDFYQEVEKQPTEIILDGKKIITFAGNIGPGLGLELLPKVARKLSVEGITNFRFVIIGDGLAKETVEKLIAEEQVADYFQFLGRKSATDIPKYMAQTDIAYISLAPSPLFDKAIPAKVQSTLACAKPLLVSANGEVPKIVEEAQCGYSSESGNEEQLIQNIKQMLSLTSDELRQLGQNALQYSRCNFNKESLIDNLESMMEDI